MSPCPRSVTQISPAPETPVVSEARAGRGTLHIWGSTSGGVTHLEASHISGVAHLWGGSHIWGSDTSVTHLRLPPGMVAAPLREAAHLGRSHIWRSPHLGGHRGTGATRERSAPCWPQVGTAPRPPRMGKLRHDPNCGPFPARFGGEFTAPQSLLPPVLPVRVCRRSPNTPKGGPCFV